MRYGDTDRAEAMFGDTEWWPQLPIPVREATHAIMYLTDITRDVEPGSDEWRSALDKLEVALNDLTGGQARSCLMHLIVSMGALGDLVRPALGNGEDAR